MNDEVYTTRDGRFSVERCGVSVRYIRDGSVVADWSLASEDLANKKFNQLRRLLISTGGEFV